jgi:thioredoxin-like negative regulator of GroEL
VRNASYIAMTCLLFVAVAGCSKGGKITVGDPSSDTFKDGQYYQSLMGLNVAKQFEAFLQRCTPADRVKYINKSVEEGPATHFYPLKPAYEHFVNDSNAEVAAAAKEALSKVPTQEEYEKLRKEEIEAQKK